jgi:hypothetical protein
MLTLKNRHEADPPEFDTEDPDLRYFYFENQYREQLVYVWDQEHEQGTLYHGDADWNGYKVVNGMCPTLVLDHPERFWLLACWLATGGAYDRQGEKT